MKATTATLTDKEMTTITDTTTATTNTTNTTNIKHYEVPDRIKHLTKEEEEKHIKYWNKRIECQQLKKGIHKNKDDYQNTRYKKYVREENKLRAIFKHRPDLLPHNQLTTDAPGKKKPDKHTYPTTNKEMWDNLINERYGIENPEIINLRKQRQQPTQIKLPSKYLEETKEQPIMLYDGESVAFYQAKIKPRIKTEQTIDVWRKERTRQRIKVRVEEWNYNEENLNRKISTPIGEITISSLLKTMLVTDAKIYKILYIHHRQPQQPQQSKEGVEM